MRGFGSALVAAALARVAARRFAGRNPRGAQERTLRKLVQKAERTAFGRAHGFSRVRSAGDFRERVPLRRYADLEPWFARGLRGESDVTWPGCLRYFAMSSGTTSGNKYLPLSFDSIRAQQRGGFEPLASYLAWTRDRTLFDGAAILLGGTAALDENEHGILVGDNTGIMARHVPRLVRRQYRPSEPVGRLRDWDQKIAALASECLDDDVRLVAGTPSWFPGLFDRLLETARERGRTARSARDVWPDLRLLTGGGISYEPYRSIVEARLGGRVAYVDVYNATEGGIMGVQDRPDEPGMQLLADAGVYFELVPVDEIDRPDPRRLPLWEAELGVTYALVVSTPSGIFGYVIGDCVRFVDRFPHRFTFEGRTAGFLNVTGEHVSQGELERAVTSACRTGGAELADFAVAASVTGGDCPARHVYYVELRAGEPELDRLGDSIDRDIQEQNGDYAAHRSSRVGLGAPVVRRVPEGTFHSFMSRRGKLGGQNKVPRVLRNEDEQGLLEAAGALGLAESVEARA